MLKQRCGTSSLLEGVREDNRPTDELPRQWSKVSAKLARSFPVRGQAEAGPAGGFFAPARKARSRPARRSYSRQREESNSVVIIAAQRGRSACAIARGERRADGARILLQLVKINLGQKGCGGIHDIGAVVAGVDRIGIGSYGGLELRAVGFKREAGVHGAQIGIAEVLNPSFRKTQKHDLIIEP